MQGGLSPPTLVFVQTKERAQELFKELLYDGIHVDVIHSERSASIDLPPASTDAAFAPTDLALAPTDLDSASTDLAPAPTELDLAPTDLAPAPTDLASAPTDLALASTVLALDPTIVCADQSSRERTLSEPSEVEASGFSSVQSSWEGAFTLFQNINKIYPSPEVSTSRASV